MKLRNLKIITGILLLLAAQFCCLEILATDEPDKVRVNKDYIDINKKKTYAFAVKDDTRTHDLMFKANGNELILIKFTAKEEPLNSLAGCLISDEEVTLHQSPTIKTINFEFESPGGTPVSILNLEKKQIGEVMCGVLGKPLKNGIIFFEPTGLKGNYRLAIHTPAKNRANFTVSLGPRPPENIADNSSVSKDYKKATASLIPPHIAMAVNKGKAEKASEVIAPVVDVVKTKAEDLSFEQAAKEAIDNIQTLAVPQVAITRIEAIDSSVVKLEWLGNDAKGSGNFYSIVLSEDGKKYYLRDDFFAIQEHSALIKNVPPEVNFVQVIASNSSGISRSKAVDIRRLRSNK